MDCGCARAVQCGGMRWVRAGGHSTVGRRHQSHLSLKELQDHINVCSHTGLQSGQDKKIKIYGFKTLSHIFSLISMI